MDKDALKVINSYKDFANKAYAYLRFLIAPIEKVEKFIPKKGNVLDIGCGYGVASAFIALKSKKRHVIGSDFNKKRIKVAKETFSNQDFYVEDLLSTKSKKKFDCILLIDVIHHVEYKRQDGLLNACKKHLSKNGVLIIKDIDKEPKRKYYWNYLHDRLLNGLPLCFNSSIELTKKLKNLGFEVKYHEIRNPFYPHFVLTNKIKKD